MKKKPPFKKRQISAIFEELEPRLLFSAGVEGFVAGDALQQGVTEFVVDDNLQLLRAANSSAVSHANKSVADSTLEIVFVDAATPDKEQLLDDLVNSSDNASRNFQIIQLDADSDGVLQISQALASYQNVDAIHIISHGSDGTIVLGDSSLNSSNLASYQDTISGWATALAADADILIYGCNLAVSDGGQALINELSTLTDADIAASTNLTGNVSVGGDWDLEFNHGQIDTQIAFSTTLQQSWEGTLLDFQDGLNGYSSTVDTFLNEASATENNSTNVELQVDLDDGAADTAQALMRFDNIFGSGAGQIPVNAMITSASLTVNVTNVSNSGAAISMHEMLTGWSDTDTWSSMSNGVSINDIDANATADSILANPATTGPVTFTGLESRIQSWLDGASTNNGWVIVIDNTNGWDFDSSESGIKPVLSVTYVTPDSQTSTAHTLIVDTADDVMDGDATSIDTLLADKGADGKISLREAIWAANNTSNVDASTPDVINVAIGSGAQTINVGAGGLPLIEDAVVLDATTQPGYSGTPLITLDGTNATGSTGGIVLRTNDSTVSGFIVQNFPDEGIEIDGSTGYGDNNIIENNWIGITAAGVAAGNGDDGILVSENADNNEVRNNIVAASGGDGIHVRNNSIGNWIWGNTIGLGIDGTTLRPNAVNGVYLSGTTSGTIVGTDADGTNDAAERNVIGGNLFSGVYVDSGSNNETIAGNYIGVAADGTTARGNQSDGITVMGSNETIGGTAAGAGNLISGNAAAGIHLAGNGSNVVQGNYIGTDVSGTTILANSGQGIYIESTSGSNIIGGAATGAGNLISGNNASNTATSAGIYVLASGNTIQGNLIGTDITGTQNLANNGAGIALTSAAASNLIGGTDNASGNIIGFNNGDGVRLFSAAGNGNSILGNEIFLNGGNGIDLQNNGVTANDSGDGDAGPNNLQNFPLVTSADRNGIFLILAGSLDTDGLNTQYLLEFYGNASGTEEPTHGEGRYYLGSTTVMTDGAGDATFSNVSLTGVTLTDGDYVTATATVIDAPGQMGIDDQLAYGSTSEFAANIAITSSNTAPSLNGVNNLTSISEDPVSNPGTLVSALIAGHVNDPDAGAVSGIAVTAVDNSNGVWEYTIDGGSNWNPFGAPADATARLLADDANTLVRFVPATNWNGSVTNGLTFRAWDQFSGTNGGTADTSGPSGTILDDFSTVSYSNDNGTLTGRWTTDWIENDSGGGGFNSGNYFVTAGTLQFGESSSGQWIYREADLSGATAASFSFDVTGNGLGGGGDISVQVSGNGGTSYTTLAHITQATGTGTLSFDISPYIAADTRIRFYDNAGGGKEIFLDNIQITVMGNSGAMSPFSATTQSAAITVNAVSDAPFAVDDYNSLDFDGVDDYVMIADSASLTMTSTLTMEAWINPDASTNVTRMIINKEGEYEVAIFADGTLAWGFANTDPGWAWHNTGYVVADDVWTHIAVSYDNGTVSTYANGTLVEVYAGSGSIGDAHPTLDEVRIGGRSNGPAGQYFDGQIDEVRIWDSARTQSQITDNIDVNLSGAEAGLAGYWRFNEGAGLTANDLTANANNGTLTDEAATGAPLWNGYTTDQNTQINISAANGIVSNDVDADGDVLTVTQVNGSNADVGVLVSLSSGANLTVGTLGAFIYDPNGAFDGLAGGESATDSFTYTVSDGNGGTDSATVYVTVMGVEDAPTAITPNAFSVDESVDTSAGYSLGTLSHNDPDTSNTITFSIFGGADAASFSIGGIGADELILTAGVLDFETRSSYTVIVEVDDGTSTYNESIIVSVNDINDAPVLGNNTLTVNEGQTVAITSTQISATDADNTDAQITFTISALTNGQFERISTSAVVTSFTQEDITNNDIRFVHDGGEVAPAYQVTVSDGTLADGPAAAAITFSANVNDAPVLGNNALTVNEGQTVAITSTQISATDSDNTDAQITFTISGLTNGQFERISTSAVVTSFTQDDISNNDIRFVHDGSENAPAYQVTVSDGTLADGPASAAITFSANVNDAPVLGNNSLSVDEGQTVVLTAADLSATDADNTDAQITFTISALTNGQFERISTSAVVTSFTQDDITNNDIRFVHDGGEVAPAYQVTVSDGTLADGPAAAAITFSANVNDAPVLGNNALTVNEGQTVVLTAADLSATDADNTDAQITFTISALTNGQFERISTSAVVTSFTQDDISNNDIRFVHDGSENAPAYQVTVSDGTLADGPGSAAITFSANVNDAPVLGNNALTVNEGQTVVLTAADLSATDADNTDAQITFTISALTNGQFERISTSAVVTSFTQDDITNNDIRFVHDGGEVAPAYQVTVSDGSLADGPASAAITFSANVNDAPVLGNNSLSVDEGQTVVLTAADLSATDADNTDAQITFTISALTNGQFERISTSAVVTSFTQDDITNSDIRFVHDGSEVAPAYQVTVSDGTLADGPAAAAITFSANVNDAPVLGNNALTVNEGQTVAITSTQISATDSDNTDAQITFTISGLTNGQFERISTSAVVTSFTQDDITNNDIRFVHDGGEVAPAYQVTVSDGTLADGPASAAITFSANVNDAPVLGNNSLSVDEGQTVVLTAADLSATDADNTDAQITFTISALTNGQFERISTSAVVTSFTQDDITNNDIRFVHDGGEVAPAYQVTVSDGTLADGPAAAAITFSANVNDAPVLGNNALTVNEGQTVVLTAADLSATDADNTDAQITFTISSLTNGQFERISTSAVVTSFTQDDITNNDIRFVHDGGENAPAYQVTVSDGTLADGPASAAITFSANVNDAPVLGNNALTVNEGQTVVLTAADLSATDADNTDAQITFTISALTNGQFERISTSAVVTSFTQDDITNNDIRFVHDGGEVAPAYQVTVSDGSLADGPAAAAITFSANVNDAPVLGNNALTVNEGQTVAITSTQISATDSDNTDAQITFTISALTNGQFERISTSAVVTSFTQDDISNNDIRFVHDGSENAPAYQVTVSDGSLADGPGSAAITFSANVNDAPVLGNNALTVNEGQTVVLTAADLSATDADNTDAQITFTISALTNGQFERISTSAVVTSFTQDDITNNDIRFVHDGSEVAPAYQVTVSDGSLSDGPAAAAITFSANVNDAPVLGNNSLSVDEGQTVVLTAADLSATDADNTDAQITFTISALTNGQFERISTSAVVTSFTQDDITNNDIRFVHDGSENAPAYQVTVSDGTLADGPASAAITFSANVNDAPVLGNNALTVNEGQTVAITSTQISATDADNTDAQITFTISALTNGQFERISTSAVVTSFTQDDISNNDIRFVHDGSENAPAYQVTVSDGSLADGPGSAAITFSANVNDAPVLGNNALTVNEGQTVAITSTQISATDADNTDAQITFTISALTNGQFERISTSAVVTSFTQDDITNNDIRFVHDGGEVAPAYSVTVSDGALTTTPAAAAITFSANVNDAPVLGNNALTVNEGQTVAITSTQISATDSDNTDAQITFTISALTNGQFERISTSAVVTSFTQDDITNNDIRFVHDGGEVAPAYQVTVSDGTLADGPAAAAITFSANVNDAPVLGNNALTVNEGQTVAITSTQISATDSDNTDAQITFTISSLTNGQFERISTSAVVTSFTQDDISNNDIRFVHDGSENAPAYQVTVSDGSLSDGPGSAAITFSANVNDAPVLGNNALTVNEGQTVVLTAADLSATDADNTDAQITFTISALTNGQFERISTSAVVTSFTQDDISNNDIRFVHDGGEVAPAYQVTVSDGSLADGPASAAITFSANVNDAPVLGNNALTVNEGQTVAITSTQISATDSDNTDAQITFTISALTNGQFERISTSAVVTSFTQDDISNNDIRFVHDGSENAPAYQVTVSDGSLADGPASAAITFSANVNDAPVLGNNALTVNEGQTVVLTAADLSATDADNTDAQITFTISALTNGQFERISTSAVVTSFTQDDITNNDIRFVHDGSENAPAYQVTVSDGTLADGPASAAITFSANVNDAPVLGNNALTVNEGQTVAITSTQISATDSDNTDTQITFTISALTNGQFERISTSAVVTSFTQDDITNNDIRFVHDGGEVAPAYSVTVSDGALTTTPAAAAITFSANVNDAPVLGNNALTVNEGQTVVLTAADLSATDADNTDAQITFTISGLTNGQFERISTSAVVTSFTQDDITNNDIRFVHDGSENAPAYQVTVSDGTLADGPASAAITFSANVNDAPVLGNNALTVNEGQTVAITSTQISATDSDNTDAQITFTISALTNGQFERISTSAVVTSFTQDDISNNDIRFVHDGSENAPAYQVTVSDGTLADGPASAAITFSANVNDAPVLGNNALTVNEGQTVAITSTQISATDSDNTDTQITFTISALTNGQFERISTSAVVTTFTQDDISNNDIRFVHDGGEVAPAYQVTVSDGSLADGPAAAAITFSANVNDAPVLGNNALTVNEGQTVVLTAADLSATDADNTDAQITFTISALTNGQFERISTSAVVTSFTQDDITNNDIRFVHDGGEVAPAYQVTVSDGSLADGPASAAITFTANVNDAPVLGNNALTVNEGQTVAITSTQISATDSDNTDAQITFTISALTNGQFERISTSAVVTTFTQDDITNNDIRFVHDGSENAPAYQVTVSDGTLADGPASAAITFSANVNDAPVLGNNALTVNEGQTVAITSTQISATDSDNTDAQITFAISSISNGQFERISTSAVVTSFTQDDITNNDIRFVHDGGEVAPAYQVTVSDGSLADGPASAAITFTANVNDAPVLGNNALTVNEGQTVAITSTQISATDSDNTDAQITFTISALTNGQFERISTSAVVTSFTQDDITNNDIRFVHDGGEVAPAYQVTVSDGTLADGPASAAITFSANVNDAPVLGNNALTVNEGQTVAITSTQISATDSDNTDAQITFTISSLSNGQFERISTSAVVTSFTQDDISNNDIRFVHDGSENAPAYQVTVSDGTLADGPASAAITFSANVNDAPVLGNNALTVNEGQTVAITSTQISATDSDNTDTQITFTISGLTNGQFERISTSAVVTSFTQDDITNNDIRFVHDGSEVAPAYQVTVSDGSLADGPAAAAITFSANVNDAPVLGNNALTVNEGQTVAITSTQISATDSDNTDAQITFTISGLTNGQFERISTSAVVTSFTQDDISNNDIRFVHDGSENAPAYQVTVSDGTLADGPASAAITFSANVNDAPVLGNNALTVNEGQTVVLTAADLSATDADNTDAQITFTISTLTNGQFERISTSAVVTSFTQDDISNNDIRFVHDGSENAPAYQVTVSDGSLADGPASAAITFSANVNDAPVLGNNSLSVDEGQTVVLTAADLSATDADNTDAQITFTISSLTNGQFERISTSAVVTSFTQDDITNNDIRFVHDGSENAPAYQVTVSDGTLADGPGSAAITFSANVNDAPVLGNNALTVNEGQTVVLTAADLSATDADNTDAQITFTISSLTNGQFERISTSAVVTSFTQDDITNNDIRFVHDGGEVAPAYQVTVSDGTLADGPAAAAITFSANVNDAPVLGNNALNVNEGQTVAITSTQISATDSDNTDAQITFTISALTNGQFERISTSAVVTSFTQDDISNNDIRFVHDGGEVAPAYQVTVSDGSITDGPIAANIVFNANVNDSPVVNDQAFTIEENSANGTLVGVVQFSDNDANDDHTFSINGRTGAFTINPSTGEITVADSELLDFETTPQLTLAVQITDNGTPALSTTANITVTLQDLAEFAISAAEDTDTTANVIDIHAGVGAPVGITVQAIDANSADTITYSLDDDAGGVFAIDSVTGVVTLSTPLDTEFEQSYVIVARALSSDGSTTTQAFQIDVYDSSVNSVNNEAGDKPFDDDTNTVPPTLEDPVEIVTIGDEEGAPEINEDAVSTTASNDEAPYDRRRSGNADGGNAAEVAGAITEEQVAEAVSELAEQFLVPANDANIQQQNIVVTMQAPDFEQNFERKLVADIDSVALNNVLADYALWEQLQKMREEMDGGPTEVAENELIVKIMTGSGVALSAGFVTWVLRGGSLLASLLSTLPLWKGFDPLPILSVKDKKTTLLTGVEPGSDTDSDTDSDTEEKSSVDSLFKAGSGHSTQESGVSR